MTTGEAIVAVLIADSAVFALVAKRIYPNKAPDQAATPYIVYQDVSTVDENALVTSATKPLSNTRLQVDCYAPRYLDAHEVADAVNEVLRKLSSRALSCWRLAARDLYDDATQLNRASADFAVWR